MTGGAVAGVEVLAFVPDLLDRSRLSAAWPGTVFAASPEGLLEAVAQSAPRVVVIDLGRPAALGVLPALVGSAPRVVGFAAHVDHDVLESAAAAGCHAVPRSVFFRTLGDLLRPSPGTET